MFKRQNKTYRNVWKYYSTNLMIKACFVLCYTIFLKYINFFNFKLFLGVIKSF